MQKFSDPHMKTCPDCGGSVTKLMSLSSFALKGTGWYTTDYKKRPKSEESAKEDQSSSSADEKSDKSKPDKDGEKKADSSAKKEDTKSEKTKSEKKTETKSKTQKSP